MRHYAPEGGVVSVQELRDQYLASKRISGRREKTLKEIPVGDSIWFPIATAFSGLIFGLLLMIGKKRKNANNELESAAHL